MKPIRVAVIGAGVLGSRHARVYSEMKNVELVGVCDVIADKAAQVAKECHTTFYQRYHDLLDKAEAASIAVPSSLHYVISKEFLEKGVDLLIEKPITTQLEEANQLLSIARSKNAVLQVGHIERFNSAIRSAKQVIHAPRFIECHRLGPFNGRIQDVGVVLDLMIHDIDIVLDLVSSPVESIDAVGVKILSQHEDLANARIRFKNGTVCNLTASRVTLDTMRKIRIFQNDAYISLDYISQEAHIYRKQGLVITHKKIEIEKQDPLKEELTSFIDCVHTRQKPLVSGEEGCAALELALKIVHQIQ